MTDFTRLTVLGSTHKAELVIPSDETVGSLIPRLMELLQERGGPVARPLTLVRRTGEQLDLALTSNQQLLEDGEVLRLMRLDSAPPPPMVADVTDVVAESLSDRPDLWSTSYRRGAAAIFIGAAAVIGGLTLPFAPIVILASAVGVLLVIAVITGRMAFGWVAAASTAAAVGFSVALASAIVATLGVSLDMAPLFLVCFALLFVWFALGIGVGLGLGVLSAVRGSAIGFAAAALPLILLAAGVQALGVIGITGVAAVAGCGLLPWYAMSTAGLTGLDDQVATGRTRHRAEVMVTVLESYHGLSWSAIAIALPLAATGSYLVTSPNPWALVLGIAIALVTAFRTRAFPLAIQATALWIAAAVILLVGVVIDLAARQWFVPAVLGAVALVGALAAGATPAPHQRASLRRFGNLIEAFAVISMVPLLLGIFDIYAQLLGTF
jgi:type VII secretion integral membrane protein EccD